MILNRPIPAVREDFGFRLQCLVAYIEAPDTVTEPFFHDDEMTIINALLYGQIDSREPHVPERTVTEIAAPLIV